MHIYANSHCIVDGRIEFSTTRVKYLTLSLFSTGRFEKERNCCEIKRQYILNEELFYN